MSCRTLKHARSSLGPLRANPAHQFAAAHALSIYGSDAVYSFIPKNACSTMRTSIAMANGCIADQADFNWIHENNETFRATLAELVKAAYTFTILRDPFTRLASVYLEKIVSKTTIAWALRTKTGYSINLDTLSFTDFVDVLSKANNRSIDEHWRPQCDFMIYEQYDDYFSVKGLGSDIAEIEAKAKINMVDARALTAHGLDQYECLSDTDDYSMMPACEIQTMKAGGECPHPRSLYNASSMEIVSKLYARDIALYKQKVRHTLLFDTRASL